MWGKIVKGIGVTAFWMMAALLMGASSASAAKFWNTKTTYKTTKGDFKFYSYLSCDGEEAWIYKVAAKKKGDSPKKLIFPKEVKKKKVTRLGAKQPVDCDGGYNIFGAWEERFHGIDGSALVSEEIKTISMPDSVTEIVDDAFCAMLSLEKVKISENVTSIDHGTFADCRKLREVRLPGKLKDFDKSCFEDCKKLERITMSPKNKKYAVKNNVFLTNGGKNLYWVIPNITKVKIPDSVTTIEENAFKDCRAVTVRLGKKLKNFQADTVTGGKIKNVEIGKNRYFAKHKNCIYRKKDKTLFIGIAKNRKLVVSEKVKRITNEASVCGDRVQFNGLKVLDIPASVTWLGKRWLKGFGFCSPEKTYFRGKKPPQLETGKADIYDVLPAFGEVYVPKKSLRTYQNWYKSAGEYQYIKKHNWKTF